MTALHMRIAGISRSSHELIARKYEAFHGVIRTEGETKRSHGVQMIFNYGIWCMLVILTGKRSGMTQKV